MHAVFAHAYVKQPLSYILIQTTSLIYILIHTTSLMYSHTAVQTTSHIHSHNIFHTNNLCGRWKHRSCVFFDAKHPLRRACARIVLSRAFECFILVLILCSCVLLALDQPVAFAKTPFYKCIICFVKNPRLFCTGEMYGGGTPLGIFICKWLRRIKESLI